MADRKLFDQSDPYDAIAHTAKSEIASAFLRALKQANKFDIDDGQRIDALIVGLMVGACGCAGSLVTVDSHHEIRAHLIALVPHCFDQAREIAGLEPLSELQ